MTAIAEAPLPPTAGLPATAPARLTVEYWTVTMDGQDSCGSCDTTLTTLQETVTQIQPLAERLGITVDLTPRAVATWAQALDHTIVASPTIRASGHELRPTHPDNSEERVWRWRGTTSTTAPAEAMAHLLVQALATRSQQLGDYLAHGGPAPYIRQHLHAEPADTAPAADTTECGSATCT